MRSWKAVLGVGAACAACCAVPLVGGVAALTAGTTALAATGSALLACADEFAPLAIGLLALAAVGGAAAWWWRRAQRGTAARPRRPAAEPAMPAGADDPVACTLPPALAPPRRKPCGCEPGACGSPTMSP